MKFLSNKFNLFVFFGILLIFFTNSCNSINKEEKNCYYSHPRNCEQFISQKIFKLGSRLPSDGVILLEDWTFYLTYFDTNTSKISEKYIKMDCNCEIVYFGDENPLPQKTL